MGRGWGGGQEGRSTHNKRLLFKKKKKEGRKERLLGVWESGCPGSCVAAGTVHSCMKI